MNGRRQSARLKTLPQKTFKDDSDDELEKTGTRKRVVKRLRDEESFRVEDDLEVQSNKKRARTSASTSGGGKLSLLPTMPMDILYTIFNYLPPKSLLALTKVNQVFRKTLVSSNSTFIWNRTIKSCKAPAPFPGTLSEIEWVRLLFGSTHCQECGHKGVLSVNFVLQKRICNACVKETGVSKGRFKSRYPGVDKAVLDFVIPIDGGLKNGHTSYYSTSEIDRVLARLNACQGPEEAEEYKKERREYIQRVKAHDQVCCKWVGEDHARQQEDVRNVREARFEAIKSRLVEMGYTDKDIETARGLACVTKDAFLTDRGWASIKKEVLDTVKHYRLIRLLVEKPDIATSRCQLIAQHYIGYKKSLTPEEWFFFPCIEAICFIPRVAAVLVLPDNIQVTEGDLSLPLASLPQDIGVEIGSVQREIASESRLYNVEWALRPYSPPGKVEFDDFHDTFSGNIWLGPAIAQARCYICKCLCTSVHTLARHLTGPCKIQMVRRKIFHIRLRGFFDIFCSRAAACLVWATGLDVMTTTAHQMDDRGVFYECLKCPTGTQPFIGTWRECVIHAYERPSYQHCSHENTWDQGQNAPIFKLFEGERSDSRNCWACNHCNAQVEELTTRDSIVAHLWDEHQIFEPHVPKDFFYAAVVDQVAQK
ncbi:hypothetical protein L218DRAFT_1078989 [Marasmius fiardii PR-910]|nr:hypothetical protein L218DRAFT_1078989 [Marasmius fiardii PR-910]